MIWRPHPYLIPLIIVPSPELLCKFGKAAMKRLRIIREKAKAKGREHREFFQ